MAGGTFRRWDRITEGGGNYQSCNVRLENEIVPFCLCKRTYSGHLTKRVRSPFGRASPPIPNDLGRDSKSGFFAGAFFYKRRQSPAITRKVADTVPWMHRRALGPVLIFLIRLWEAGH